MGGCVSYASNQQDTSEASLTGTTIKAQQDTSKTSHQIGIEKALAPAEAVELVKTTAADTVADVLRDPEYLHIPEFSLDNIQVMDPYTAYVKQQADGTFQENNIYYFPVVSDQNVLFTLDVSLTPDGYICSVSNEIGEQLTKLMGSDECSRVYIDNGEDYSKCEYTINASQDTNENLKVLLDLSSTIN